MSDNPVVGIVEARIKKAYEDLIVASMEIEFKYWENMGKSLRGEDIPEGTSIEEPFVYPTYGQTKDYGGR